MRKIILIGGDLASGKSTFSKFISEKYHLSIINKDRLKEIAGDVIYVSNREENKKLSVLSFEYIKYIIESTFEDLIIESNFKPYEMQQLKKYLDQNDILSLKFRGVDVELHQRFLSRLEGERHYVHRSQDLSKLEDFIAVEEELRSVEYIGKVIDVFVEGNQFATENESLLKEIETFLKG